MIRPLVLALALVAALVIVALLMFQPKEQATTEPTLIEAELIVTSLSEAQYIMVREAMLDSGTITQMDNAYWEAWIAYFEVQYTLPTNQLVSELESLDLEDFYLRPDENIRPEKIIFTFDRK